MSLKLILLVCLIGAALSLDVGNAVSKNDCDGKTTDNSSERDETKSNDNYKWWEIKDQDDYVKSIQYLDELVKSIFDKADDLRVGGDAKKWSAAYNKAVDIVAKVSVVYGKLIDVVFPELGPKFADMCLTYLTLHVCLFVPDKLRNWHGGQTLPDLCTKADYGSEWGCRSSKNYTTVDSIKKGYGVLNIIQQVEDLINKYTDGKGVDALDPNIRETIGSIVNFADILNKVKIFNPKQFVKALEEVYVTHGGTANNIKPGYGNKFFEDYIKFYDIAFLEAGLPDLSSIKAEVLKRISTCGPYNWTRSTTDESNENKTSQTEKSNHEQSKQTEQSSNDATNSDQVSESEQLVDNSNSNDESNHKSDNGDQVDDCNDNVDIV